MDYMLYVIVYNCTFSVCHLGLEIKSEYIHEDGTDQVGWDRSDTRFLKMFFL